MKPWKIILSTIQDNFMFPWKEGSEDLRFKAILSAVLERFDNLKHPYSETKPGGAAFLGNSSLPDYRACKKAVMPKMCGSYEKTLEEMLSLFNGTVNWGHPFTMCNVNPPANIASIIGVLLCSLFNPDLIEGEYSWNVAAAEIESGAMLSDLIGWDPVSSGGLYTFGGTGSYLYALKYALTSVFGLSTRDFGLREDGQLLVSNAGHYAKYTCTDWTGLGRNNIRTIATDANSSMDMEDLARQMKDCKEKQQPIVMIVCTAGTTDSLAIDSAAEIRNLINSYENARGYPKPFLYADAVIGWPWMVFKNYDRKLNPLMFETKTLDAVYKTYSQISELKAADAIGIDFHKTGWTTLTSSFFLAKDYEDFTKHLARSEPGYLQKNTDYNPFIYSLETTRGASGAVAGWASLKIFGYEGYQVILARMTEMAIYFRELLEAEKNAVSINTGSHGFVTLFRIYPPSVDAKARYLKELHDPDHLNSLHFHNSFQEKIAKNIFKNLRLDGSEPFNLQAPPYVSLTKSAQHTFYPCGRKEAVYALKAFPMTPFLDRKTVEIIYKELMQISRLVIDS